MCRGQKLIMRNCPGLSFSFFPSWNARRRRFINIPYARYLNHGGILLNENVHNHDCHRHPSSEKLSFTPTAVSTPSFPVPRFSHKTIRPKRAVCRPHSSSPAAPTMPTSTPLEVRASAMPNPTFTPTNTRFPSSASRRVSQIEEDEVKLGKGEEGEDTSPSPSSRISATRSSSLHAVGEAPPSAVFSILTSELPCPPGKSLPSSSTFYPREKAPSFSSSMVQEGDVETDLLRAAGGTSSAHTSHATATASSTTGKSMVQEVSSDAICSYLSTLQRVHTSAHRHLLTQRVFSNAALEYLQHLLPTQVKRPHRHGQPAPTTLSSDEEKEKAEGRKEKQGQGGEEEKVVEWTSSMALSVLRTVGVFGFPIATVPIAMEAVQHLLDSSAPLSWSEKDAEGEEGNNNENNNSHKEKRNYQKEEVMKRHIESSLASSPKTHPVEMDMTKGTPQDKHDRSGKKIKERENNIINQQALEWAQLGLLVHRLAQKERNNRLLAAQVYLSEGGEGVEQEEEEKETGIAALSSCSLSEEKTLPTSTAMPTSMQGKSQDTSTFSSLPLSCNNNSNPVHETETSTSTRSSMKRDSGKDGCRPRRWSLPSWHASFEEDSGMSKERPLLLFYRPPPSPATLPSLSSLLSSNPTPASWKEKVGTGGVGDCSTRMRRCEFPAFDGPEVMLVELYVKVILPRMVDQLRYLIEPSHRGLCPSCFDKAKGEGEEIPSERRVGQRQSSDLPQRGHPPAFNRLELEVFSTTLSVLYKAIGLHLVTAVASPVAPTSFGDEEVENSEEIFTKKDEDGDKENEKKGKKDKSGNGGSKDYIIFRYPSYVSPRSAQEYNFSEEERKSGNEEVLVSIPVKKISMADFVDGMQRCVDAVSASFSSSLSRATGDDSADTSLGIRKEGKEGGNTISSVEGTTPLESLITPPLANTKDENKGKGKVCERLTQGNGSSSRSHRRFTSRRGNQEETEKNVRATSVEISSLSSGTEESASSSSSPPSGRKTSSTTPIASSSSLRTGVPNINQDIIQPILLFATNPSALDLFISKKNSHHCPHHFHPSRSSSHLPTIPFISPGTSSLTTQTTPTSSEWKKKTPRRIEVEGIPPQPWSTSSSFSTVPEKWPGREGDQKDGDAYFPSVTMQEWKVLERCLIALLRWSSECIPLMRTRHLAALASTCSRILQPALSNRNFPVGMSTPSCIDSRTFSSCAWFTHSIANSLLYGRPFSLSLPKDFLHIRASNPGRSICSRTPLLYDPRTPRSTSILNKDKLEEAEGNDEWIHYAVIEIFTSLCHRAIEVKDFFSSSDTAAFLKGLCGITQSLRRRLAIVDEEAHQRENNKMILIRSASASYFSSSCTAPSLAPNCPAGPSQAQHPPPVPHWERKWNPLHLSSLESCEILLRDTVHSVIRHLEWSGFSPIRAVGLILVYQEKKNAFHAISKRIPRYLAKAAGHSSPFSQEVLTLREYMVINDSLEVLTPVLPDLWHQVLGRLLHDIHFRGTQPGVIQRIIRCVCTHPMHGMNFGVAEGTSEALTMLPINYRSHFFFDRKNKGLTFFSSPVKAENGVVSDCREVFTECTSRTLHPYDDAGVVGVQERTGKKDEDEKEERDNMKNLSKKDTSTVTCNGKVDHVWSSFPRLMAENIVRGGETQETHNAGEKQLQDSTKEKGRSIGGKHHNDDNEREKGKKEEEVRKMENSREMGICRCLRHYLPFQNNISSYLASRPSSSADVHPRNNYHHHHHQQDDHRSSLLIPACYFPSCRSSPALSQVPSSVWQSFLEGHLSQHWESYDILREAYSPPAVPALQKKMMMNGGKKEAQGNSCVVPSSLPTEGQQHLTTRLTDHTKKQGDEEKEENGSVDAHLLGELEKVVDLLLLTARFSPKESDPKCASNEKLIYQACGALLEFLSFSSLHPYPLSSSSSCHAPYGKEKEKMEKNSSWMMQRLCASPTSSVLLHRLLVSLCLLSRRSLWHTIRTAQEGNFSPLRRGDGELRRAWKEEDEEENTFSSKSTIAQKEEADGEMGYGHSFQNFSPSIEIIFPSSLSHVGSFPDRCRVFPLLSPDDPICHAILMSSLMTNMLSVFLYHHHHSSSSSTERGDGGEIFSPSSSFSVDYNTLFVLANLSVQVTNLEDEFLCSLGRGKGSAGVSSGVSLSCVTSMRRDRKKVRRANGKSISENEKEGEGDETSSSFLSFSDNAPSPLFSSSRMPKGKNVYSWKDSSIFFTEEFKEVVRDGIETLASYATPTPFAVLQSKEEGDEDSNSNKRGNNRTQAAHPLTLSFSSHGDAHPAFCLAHFFSVPISYSLLETSAQQLLHRLCSLPEWFGQLPIWKGGIRGGGEGGNEKRKEKEHNRVDGNVDSFSGGYHLSPRISLEPPHSRMDIPAPTSFPLSNVLRWALLPCIGNILPPRFPSSSSPLLYDLCFPPSLTCLYHMLKEWTVAFLLRARPQHHSHPTITGTTPPFVSSRSASTQSPSSSSSSSFFDRFRSTAPAYAHPHSIARQLAEVLCFRVVVEENKDEVEEDLAGSMSSSSSSFFSSSWTPAPSFQYALVQAFRAALFHRNACPSTPGSSSAAGSTLSSSYVFTSPVQHPHRVEEEDIILFFGTLLEVLALVRQQPSSIFYDHDEHAKEEKHLEPTAATPLQEETLGKGGVEGRKEDEKGGGGVGKVSLRNPESSPAPLSDAGFTAASPAVVHFHSTFLQTLEKILQDCLECLEEYREWMGGDGATLSSRPSFFSSSSLKSLSLLLAGTAALPSASVSSSSSTEMNFSSSPLKRKGRGRGGYEGDESGRGNNGEEEEWTVAKNSTRNIRVEKQRKMEEGYLTQERDHEWRMPRDSSSASFIGESDLTAFLPSEDDDGAVSDLSSSLHASSFINVLIRPFLESMVEAVEKRQEKKMEYHQQRKRRKGGADGRTSSSLSSSSSVFSSPTRAGGGQRVLVGVPPVSLMQYLALLDPSLLSLLLRTQGQENQLRFRHSLKYAPLTSSSPSSCGVSTPYHAVTPLDCFLHVLLHIKWTENEHHGIDGPGSHENDRSHNSVDRWKEGKSSENSIDTNHHHRTSLLGLHVEEEREGKALDSSTTNMTTTITAETETTTTSAVLHRVLGTRGIGRLGLEIAKGVRRQQDEGGMGGRNKPQGGIHDAGDGTEGISSFDEEKEQLHHPSPPVLLLLNYQQQQQQRNEKIQKLRLLNCLIKLIGKIQSLTDATPATVGRLSFVLDTPILVEQRSKYLKFRVHQLLFYCLLKHGIDAVGTALTRVWMPSNRATPSAFQRVVYYAPMEAIPSHLPSPSSVSAPPYSSRAISSFPRGRGDRGGVKVPENVIRFLPFVSLHTWCQLLEGPRPLSIFWSAVFRKDWISSPNVPRRVVDQKYTVIDAFTKAVWGAGGAPLSLSPSLDVVMQSGCHSDRRHSRHQKGGTACISSTNTNPHGPLSSAYSRPPFSRVVDSTGIRNLKFHHSGFVFLLFLEYSHLTEMKNVLGPFSFLRLCRDVLYYYVQRWIGRDTQEGAVWLDDHRGREKYALHCLMDSWREPPPPPSPSRHYQHHSSSTTSSTPVLTDNSGCKATQEEEEEGEVQEDKGRTRQGSKEVTSCSSPPSSPSGCKSRPSLHHLIGKGMATACDRNSHPPSSSGKGKKSHFFPPCWMHHRQPRPAPPLGWDKNRYQKDTRREKEEERDAEVRNSNLTGSSFFIPKGYEDIRRLRGVYLWYAYAHHLLCSMVFDENNSGEMLTGKMRCEVLHHMAREEHESQKHFHERRQALLDLSSSSGHGGHPCTSRREENRMGWDHSPGGSPSASSPSTTLDVSVLVELTSILETLYYDGAVVMAEAGVLHLETEVAMKWNQRVGQGDTFPFRSSPHDGNDRHDSRTNSANASCCVESGRGGKTASKWNYPPSRTTLFLLSLFGISTDVARGRQPGTSMLVVNASSVLSYWAECVQVLQGEENEETAFASLEGKKGGGGRDGEEDNDKSVFTNEKLYCEKEGEEEVSCLSPVSRSTLLSICQRQQEWVEDALQNTLLHPPGMKEEHKTPFLITTPIPASSLPNERRETRELPSPSPLPSHVVNAYEVALRAALHVYHISDVVTLFTLVSGRFIASGPLAAAPTASCALSASLGTSLYTREGKDCRGMALERVGTLMKDSSTHLSSAILALANILEEHLSFMSGKDIIRSTRRAIVVYAQKDEKKKTLSNDGRREEGHQKKMERDINHPSSRGRTSPPIPTRTASPVLDKEHHVYMGIPCTPPVPPPSEMDQLADMYREVRRFLCAVPVVGANDIERFHLEDLIYLFTSLFLPFRFTLFMENEEHSPPDHPTSHVGRNRRSSEPMHHQFFSPSWSARTLKDERKDEENSHKFIQYVKQHSLITAETARLVADRLILCHNLENSSFYAQLERFRTALPLVLKNRNGALSVNNSFEVMKESTSEENDEKMKKELEFFGLDVFVGRVDALYKKLLYSLSPSLLKFPDAPISTVRPGGEDEGHCYRNDSPNQATMSSPQDTNRRSQLHHFLRFLSFIEVVNHE